MIIRPIRIPINDNTAIRTVLIITVGSRSFTDHLVHVTGQFAMCSDKLAGQYFSASTSSVALFFKSCTSSSSDSSEG